ncbi:uncharacterized protein LOC134765695 [Penaeus indicus]|uniref:uncharacterized protein LOC134765695 n=1 Tax=Penaeus indicus TaxID=29960 RepID=UPI00300DA49A
MSRSTMPTTSSEHSTPTSAKVKRNPSSVSRKSNGDSYNLSNGKTSPLKPKSKPCCSQYHLNSVWSIWYCLVSLGFMAYLVYNGVKRFLLYASLPWPQDPPFVELNAYVGLVGASVVLLPFFLVTSLLKVGNLGNDGFKLGASLSTCSRDPPPVLEAAKGVVRNLWLHGVPTAPFLHLVAAFCLLLPRTLMDATLISAGFLPKEEIWRTDLDFLVPHNDRLAVLGANVTVSPRTPPPPTPATESSRPIVTVEEALPKALPEEAFARLPEDGEWEPVSPELLNYAVALLVFAIRYPSVFWHTNKAFGILFSLQLVVNGVHTIITLTAFNILYKLHVCGPEKELHGAESFLLNLPATVGLMLVAVMVVTVSSSAIYFYGYQKFNSFLIKSKQRFHITYDNEPTQIRPYAPHCAALVVLVALGLSHGPLLWDLSLVYRGSLDAVVMAAVIGTIVHLFLWIVLWLLLTVKSKWEFKLRVTVARACVASARSIKLVNDVELISNDQQSHAHTPLLVVGAGKAYAITDATPKKSIMSVVQKTHQDKRARGHQEEIYWLRPTQPARSPAPGKSMSPRAKVTFDEAGIMTSPRKARANKSPKPQKSTYRRASTLSESEDEAGDYALLREGPENTTQQAAQEEDPRYVDRQQILAYRRAMEERLSSQPPHVSSVPDYEDADHLQMRSPHALHQLDTQGPLTPRSTRSNDSGMVQEERSQRSDSVSTSSSNTPPENSEESGVHSGATDLMRNRSNSVDDLTQLPPDPNQVLTPPKAMSMQRPPLSSSPGSPYGYTAGGGLLSAAGTVSPVPSSVLYPAAEATVVIRRQRNLTQEIKPPVDPIYGTRSLTSFTDQQQESKKKNNEDLLAEAQNNFNSSQSTGSSGYQSGSANASSASNSSSNSPIPAHSASAFSPGQPIYGQRTHNGYAPNPVVRSSSRVSAHSTQGIYGRTTPGPHSPHRLPQAPQIPLPPIPQGAMPVGVPQQSSMQDIYGRTNSQKLYGHLGDSNSIYGPNMMRNPVGRSVSLRVSSGAAPRFSSGSFRHVPRESEYNTNV